jgi:hypothetical protein
MAFHELLLCLNFTDEQSNAIIDEGLGSPEDSKIYEASLNTSLQETSIHHMERSIISRS